MRERGKSITEEEKLRKELLNYKWGLWIVVAMSLVGLIILAIFVNRVIIQGYSEARWKLSECNGSLKYWVNGAINCKSILYDCSAECTTANCYRNCISRFDGCWQSTFVHPPAKA